ncbi:hypothetical protein O9929_17470 [Vibrio lentus]|nr:hypothetical protein [Vibrio lentus]
MKPALKRAGNIPGRLNHQVALIEVGEFDRYLFIMTAKSAHTTPSISCGVI